MSHVEIQTFNVLSSVGNFIAHKAKGLHETANVLDVPASSHPTHGQVSSPLVTVVSSSTRSHARQLPNPEEPRIKRKRTL